MPAKSRRSSTIPEFVPLGFRDFWLILTLVGKPSSLKCWCKASCCDSLDFASGCRAIKPYILSRVLRFFHEDHRLDIGQEEVVALLGDCYDLMFGCVCLWERQVLQLSQNRFSSHWKGSVGWLKPQGRETDLKFGWLKSQGKGTDLKFGWLKSQGRGTDLEFLKFGETSNEDRQVCLGREFSNRKAGDFSFHISQDCKLFS